LHIFPRHQHIGKLWGLLWADTQEKKKKNRQNHENQSFENSVLFAPCCGGECGIVLVLMTQICAIHGDKTESSNIQ
jgi:hypothetical protein